jgi:excisionase family DNA binding protein
MTRWLSVAETARRLGRNPQHVHRLIKAGTIPAVRTGTGRGVYRITEQAVTTYTRQHTS